MATFGGEIWLNLINLVLTQTTNPVTQKSCSSVYVLVGFSLKRTFLGFHRNIVCNGRKLEVPITRRGRKEKVIGPHHRLSCSSQGKVGLSWRLSGKESTCNSGAAGDIGLIPGGEDSLEEGMATPSSILAWRIKWTEEQGRLQSIGLQRLRHN